MKKLLIVCALVAGMLLGAGATAAVAGGFGPAHVVGVTGDRQDGFRVQWSNGNLSVYRPQAVAIDSCERRKWYQQARPTERQQIACRARVRADMGWLTQMRRALRHTR